MAARARCQADRHFSAAIDCRPLRFPYSTRRCGGEGPQEPEPPIAPVQSFSRLFKVVQCLKSVRSKSVQTFQISLRRRLRSTAFRRISSNNPECGCAMRLCPDDALPGPTGRGHRPPSFTCTAGADAAVFPAAPALAASAVLKTAATAGRHRTGTHAGDGLRARSPSPASERCRHCQLSGPQQPRRTKREILQSTSATASACIASTRIHQHHSSTAKPVEAQGRRVNSWKRTFHPPDFNIRNRIHLGSTAHRVRTALTSKKREHRTPNEVIARATHSLLNRSQFATHLSLRNFPHRGPPRPRKLFKVLLPQNGTRKSPS